MALQQRSLRVSMTYLGFSLGAFAIGLSEFASMSILKEIVEGLHITPEQGRFPIAAYALGVVVGAPLLAVTASRWDRKKVVLGFIFLYAVSNIAVAFSQDIAQLVVLRFLSGLPHGAYFGVATVVAVHIAPPDHRAKAVSKIFVGLSAATMVGVPISQWLVAYTSWRYAYVCVGTIAIVALIIVAIFCPSTKDVPVTTSNTELRVLRNPSIWIIFSVATIGLGGLFAVYPYIEYIFHNIAGLNLDLLPYALVLFGLGMITGTMIGGRLADRSVDRALICGMLTVTVIMASFIFLAQHGYMVFLGIFLVGVSGGLNVPILQTKIMDVAGDAQSLGAALMHSAFNISNALGAYFAGYAIETEFGYNAPAMEGVGLSLSGFFIAILALRYGKKKRSQHTQASHHTLNMGHILADEIRDIPGEINKDLRVASVTIQPSPV